MSRTKLVVCLLAIAGGTIGSFFLSLRNSSPKSSADLVARRLAAERSAEKRRFLGGRSFSSEIRPLFTRGALAPEDMPLVFSASSERARRNFSRAADVRSERRAISRRCRFYWAGPRNLGRAEWRWHLLCGDAIGDGSGRTTGTEKQCRCGWSVRPSQPRNGKKCR